jgi:glycosyltransferase involved in cell wall biosynthesis
MGLKVAMVTPWKVRCGIATYTKKLAYALAEQDVEVFIVRLPRFGKKNAEIMRDVAEKVPYDRVDLVHVQHEYGLYQYGLNRFEPIFYETLRSFGKPIVTTMHAVGNWEIDGLIAGMSKKVIAHNEFCLKRFGFPNTVIIPHGAQPVETVVDVKEAKKVLNIDLDMPVVGYLGFISSYKGLEDLVEAMMKVPKAGLLVGGGYHVETETPYMDKLKRGADKLLGKRVQWLGFVSDEKMAVTYAAMDVFVYPSRFATESGALITALSHGRAVIARNLPPFKEKEKEGALITFKDVPNLSEKIEQLLKDENLRRQLQEGARKYTEKTSWSPHIAKQHIALYEEVLSKF